MTSSCRTSRERRSSLLEPGAERSADLGVFCARAGTAAISMVNANVPHREFFIVACLLGIHATRKYPALVRLVAAGECFFALIAGNLDDVLGSGAVDHCGGIFRSEALDLG